MDREKVKEIKKWLENKITRPIDFTRPYENTLTLINELESENEALWKGVKRLKKRYKETIIRTADKCTKHFWETTQLKDRIAELKMENATKTETIAGLLKHFAERLKEKVHKRDYVQGYA